MGEMGGMGEVGAKWGKLVGNRGIAIIAHKMWVVEGCGGMSSKKMGEKREENEIRYPFFTVPFSPFFRRSKMFPTVPFVKNQLRTHQTEKNGHFCHSPTLVATAPSADA